RTPRSRYLEEPINPANRANLLTGKDTLPLQIADLRIPAPRAFSREILSPVMQPSQLLLLLATVVQLPFTNFDWRIPRDGGRGYGPRPWLDFLQTSSSVTPPTPAGSRYGVTAGPGLSHSSGVVHLNAHGVGGQQKDISPVEGIPQDDPL